MKTRWLGMLLVLGAGAFGFGLYELFELRFAAGDVYPAYSSLRADPLGTMAFYESLERLPGLAVRRDFYAGNRLPEEPHTCYLHLAAESTDWLLLPEDLTRAIDGFLARGGRLVITFLPENVSPFRFTPPAAPPPPTRSKKGSRQAKTDDAGMPAKIALKEHWGVEFRRVPLAAGPGDTHQPALAENRTGLALPSTLRWHSALVLTNLDPAWQTIYGRGTNPVVVERRFGRGTVVVATDSYFVSNEALSKERHADLLAWVIGSARQVVFDEAHFGLVDRPGTATLIRKYRLHGLAAAFIVLAGLFIWKNASTFAPPFPPELDTEEIRGKEAAAGFVNLLRRNIAPRDLLGICFEQWSKSLPHSGHFSLDRVDRAQAVLEAEALRAHTDQDPVRAYREVCHALHNSPVPGPRHSTTPKPRSAS